MPDRLASPVHLATGVTAGPGHPLAFILGPCVIESPEHTLRLARAVGELAREVGFPLVFKASFDKANRPPVARHRGPGLGARDWRCWPRSRRGLACRCSTDVHETEQAVAGRRGAWTCCRCRRSCAARPTCWWRAGAPGLPVNVKKGQFMAPDEHGPSGGQGALDRQHQRRHHRARHQLRLPQPGGGHARADAIMRDLGAPVSSTPPTPCSSPGRRGTPQAAPGSSTSSWRAARWRPAPT